MSIEGLSALINKLIDAANVTAEERVQIAVAIVTDVDAVASSKVKTASKKPVERKPLGKILVKEGDSCVCTACKVVAYKVVSTVYAEGMTGEEFLAAFDPEPKSPIDLLTDEYGNECVDCPSCGGQKTVVLIRKSK